MLVQCCYFYFFLVHLTKLTYHTKFLLLVLGDNISDSDWWDLNFQITNVLTKLCLG